MVFHRLKVTLVQKEKKEREKGKWEKRIALASGERHRCANTTRAV
jgi:hypothetical protein